MYIKNTDWKGLYELLNDLIKTKSTESLISELKSNIDRIIPANRGAPIFEISAKQPICIRWPDYSAKMIPEFNKHFNCICPVKYSHYLNSFGPISWKNYKDTEYDTDFNFPLDIGYSMGYGFRNPSDGKQRIIVLNRSRKDKMFTETDAKNFKSIIDGFSILYNQRVADSYKVENRILSLEESRGNKRLSGRELQVCRLLCSGLKAAEIAAVLEISRRTVERHTEHIYLKLNIDNRKELIRLIKS